ncbi:MAG: bifunctional phosphoglucose/phosphomannose isomerase [Bacteroidota bacterium]
MNETMKNLVADFSNHLDQALTIGRENSFVPSNKDIRNIIITGLGGSGIGGKIISQLVSGTCPVPIYINNDYKLPAFVGPHTLVVACSYSGNTEETLSSVEQSLAAGAEVFCITSGGKLAEIAREKNLGVITVPGGFPPRAAFGLTFPQLYAALNIYGFIDKQYQAVIEQVIGVLNASEEDIKRDAYVLAEKLHGKTPVIYSEAGFEGVAIRFRQQLNENSKVLCWHHILPEMNHNELVGWAGGDENVAVVLIQNESDFYRTKERFVFSKNVMGDKTSTIIDLKSQGDSDLFRALYLIHLTDWTSCYLADLRNVDAVEINVINKLKSRLAEF